MEANDWSTTNSLRKEDGTLSITQTWVGTTATSNLANWAKLSSPLEPDKEVSY
jgi:hypothetical protein